MCQFIGNEISIPCNIVYNIDILAIKYFLSVLSCTELKIVAYLGSLFHILVATPFITALMRFVAKIPRLSHDIFTCKSHVAGLTL
jgi:Na+/phosphate symporter